MLYSPFPVTNTRRRHASAPKSRRGEEAAEEQPKHSTKTRFLTQNIPHFLGLSREHTSAVVESRSNNCVVHFYVHAENPKTKHQSRIPMPCNSPRYILSEPRSNVHHLKKYHIQKHPSINKTPTRLGNVTQSIKRIQKTFLPNLLPNPNYPPSSHSRATTIPTSHFRPPALPIIRSR